MQPVVILVFFFGAIKAGRRRYFSHHGCNTLALEFGHHRPGGALLLGTLTKYDRAVLWPNIILNPAVTHSLPADFAAPKTADVG